MTDLLATEWWRARRRAIENRQAEVHSAGMPPRTLYEKIWSSHLVTAFADEALLYIDRLILHEVSSPQAFARLASEGRAVRRPETHLALVDHAVPTRNRDLPIADPQARAQVALHEANSRRNGITFFGLDDVRQGIVHVVGPEQGFTLPGITLVCGDSHTATHGAFGALAFGIGSSEAECVLATQTLVQRRAKTLSIEVSGAFGAYVGAKDLIIAVIAQIGASGGVGHAIEYRGSAVRSLSMEARMTLCNMTIEAGARIGLIAPDEVTFDYLRGRPMAPSGAAWDHAVAYWRMLATDEGAAFDRVVRIDADRLQPMASWGTSPDQALPIGSPIPAPKGPKDRAALAYMGLSEGQQLSDVAIDAVFIGSCTNSRIEDLRAAASVLAGRHKADHIQALVVPGSGLVKRQAEAEGLDKIFLAAGFEWRDSGCSLCIAMNDDQLAPGARCASTSNRNFEGRQGRGTRTHLMSPAMAAAAAVAGRIVDVRDMVG